MNDQPRQEEEVVDAVVVEDPRDSSAPPSTDLAPVAAHSSTPATVEGVGGMEVATLWNTHDPQAIVEQASKVASALANVIEKQDLAKNLGGRKKHVEIEGWQVAGTFLGAQALITDTQRVEPKSEFPVNSKRKKWGKIDGKRQVVEETEDTWTVVGWSFDAVAEVRTMDGRVIGRGEATCSREEPNWKDATDSAVKGMAQTRACSRALRQALGFIVGLAGYSATPQEEMEAAGVTNKVELPPASETQAKQLTAALSWLLPPAEVDPVLEKIRGRFDSQLPGPVAEAIAITIGARKLLEEADAKEAEAAAAQPVDAIPASSDASSNDGSQPGEKPGDPAVAPTETTEEGDPDEPEAAAEAERLEREFEEELKQGDPQ